MTKLKRLMEMGSVWIDGEMYVAAVDNGPDVILGYVGEESLIDAQLELAA